VRRRGRFFFSASVLARGPRRTWMGGRTGAADSGGAPPVRAGQAGHGEGVCDDPRVPPHGTERWAWAGGRVEDCPVSILT